MTPEVKELCDAILRVGNHTLDRYQSELWDFIGKARRLARLLEEEAEAEEREKLE